MGRGWCRFACPTLNLNELLSYTTPKVVVIKDSRLGCVRMVCFILVALYFIISSMVFQKEYMMFESVVGLTHVSLSSGPVTNQPYCAPAGFVQNAAWGNQSQLPCDPGPTAPPLRRMWLTAPSGPAGADTLFLSTVIAPATFANATGLNAASLLMKERYAQCPETSTLRLQLALQAVGLYADAQRYTPYKAGRYRRRGGDQIALTLVDGAGNKIRQVPSEYDESYIFSFAELLQAAGVNMDQELVPWTQTQQVTLRYSGFALTLTIKCPTDHGGSISGCAARAHYDKIPQAVFVPPWEEVGIQLWESRRGILLKVAISGKMGQFAWPEFILACVVAAAIFGVSAMVLDMVLQNLLPLSPIYKRIKTEESVDFGAYRSRKSEALAAVRALRLEAYSRQHGRAAAEDMAVREERADEEWAARTAKSCCLKRCAVAILGGRPLWGPVGAPVAVASSKGRPAPLKKGLTRAMDEEGSATKADRLEALERAMADVLLRLEDQRSARAPVDVVSPFHAAPESHPPELRTARSTVSSRGATPLQAWVEERLPGELPPEPPSPMYRGH